MKFDDLRFPQLLPGHKWIVKQDRDSFSTWDQLEVEIRRDRRWFTYLGHSRTFWLSRASSWWKDSDDITPPPEETELWRLYVLANAATLHEKYVERHQIPIRDKQVRDLVGAWTESLNTPQG